MLQRPTLRRSSRSLISAVGREGERLSSWTRSTTPVRSATASEGRSSETTQTAEEARCFSVDGQLKGVRYPTRRSEVEFDGPGLNYLGPSRQRPLWRLTLIHDSTEPLPDPKAAPQPSPRPNDASWEEIQDRIEELTGERNVRVRWWLNPGGDSLFCWTTRPAPDDGRYLSFAVVPARGRSGKNAPNLVSPRTRPPGTVCARTPRRARRS